MNKHLLPLLILCLWLVSCKSKPAGKQEVIPPPLDYIRAIPGDNDAIPQELAQKGQVLISYSDCYTCHKAESRAKGPAFEDIAARYPVQEAYVDMLAHRIIVGGSGAWGDPVMLPHPALNHEDAKAMVYYILSLKQP